MTRILPSFQRLVPDRYRPIQVLAEGATSVVVLAQSRTTGQGVVVSSLRREHEPGSIMESQFILQIHLLAKYVHHPAVLTLIDAGRLSSGQPFMVTPYVGGGTLKDCLPVRDPTTKRRLLLNTARIAEAVAVLHDRLGLIHQDLSSYNILVTRDRRWSYVIDLATVKRAPGCRFRERTPLLASVTPGPDVATVVFDRIVPRRLDEVDAFYKEYVVGTLPYIAPRAVLGLAGKDTDLFSLNLIVFEILATNLYQHLGLARPEEIAFFSDWPSVAQVAARYGVRLVTPHVAELCDAVLTGTSGITSMAAYALALRRALAADAPRAQVRGG